MTCVRPLTAYRKAGGSLTFSKSEGFADLPPISLACGSCIECRLKRSAMWAVRCLHESKCHSANSFLTLTFSPKSLPKDVSLNVRHLQLFMKRLRKYGASLTPARKYRFFAVGEYGEKNKRPHYHMILFGEDFAADRVRVAHPKGLPLYRSATAESIWQQGAVFIGEVVRETASYVARYMLKKVVTDKDEYLRRVDTITGEEWFVSPEFCVMSRRPGIGKDFFLKYRSDFFPSDFCVMDGREYPVPKYYSSIQEKDFPEEFESVKTRRIERARAHVLSPRQLESREKIRLARLVKRD